MKAIDKIIGYASIKGELRQISDTLKNDEVYKKLGVSAPRGLLLYGDPGVGKSLMASAIIEESGRQTFTCRKDKPNGDFVKHIKDTFDKAAENAPSIVYLDDMDKFANTDDDHSDYEEFVAIQAYIDKVKNEDVFVIATANNLDNLPESLLRAGRFDRIIEVDTPTQKDAEEIMGHYLSNKKISSDCDIKAITKIMNGNSCAELETVINEAGVYAGYERCDNIKMEHFLKAAIRVLMHIPESAINRSEDEDTEQIRHIAYHEAGHAVVREVLDPGSVTIVSTFGTSSIRHRGIMACCPDKSLLYSRKREIDIYTSLGGKASVENKFAIIDTGAVTDLKDAYLNIKDLIATKAINGFALYSKRPGNCTEALDERQEIVASAEMERYYLKTRRILIENNEFLEKIVQALMEKKILCSVDIERIRASCEIVSFEL